MFCILILFCFRSPCPPISTAPDYIDQPIWKEYTPENLKKYGLEQIITKGWKGHDKNGDVIDIDSVVYSATTTWSDDGKEMIQVGTTRVHNDQKDIYNKEVKECQIDNGDF